MPFPAFRAVAAVDTAALAHNFREIRKCAAPRRVIAVVKANAYGHGVFLVAPTLFQEGCRDFAVATLDEGAELRALLPTAKILVLGFTPPARAAELVAHRLVQTVFSLSYASALSAALAALDAELSVELKIDGGMCRLGFFPDALSDLYAAARTPRLRPVGLYTHFPVAGEDIPRTAASLAAFRRCRAALAEKGLPLFAHTLSSAGLLAPALSGGEGVRPGLLLYGLSPLPTKLPLRPALSLWASVVQLHDVPAGTPVGYGGAFVTKTPSRIGTLPIGYADGFPRALAALTPTLFHAGHGYPAPVAGRVCMDQLMLDLTNTPAAVGDRVCLWRSAAEPARLLGTIPYEVLTSISARPERRDADTL